MPLDPAAFRHHPGLLGKIREPEDSFFRSMVPAELEAETLRRGGAPIALYSDADREAMRHATLAPHYGEDIWVFAYGSLMWDPAIYFAELRRATLPGWHRSFCLVDRSGARGTEAAPGVMAGLGPGGSCEGLVFRIDAARAEVETEVIWRREMVAPCYHAVFAPVETAQGVVQALCFVADPEAEMIEADLPHAERVRYLATGEGFLGSSRDYLEKVIAGCRDLGIDDPDLDALLAEVAAWPSPASEGTQG
ncbi:gamma-glutamylcyclotransferase [Pseudooceanicola sp. 200-1SW]|uniref:gamma-glutamylcyclotransferase n=1 Tax=Pseudooceanicola sp. 200-1SW TaxID=3425949 RepID=UPI003D7F1A3A